MRPRALIFGNPGNTVSLNEITKCLFRQYFSKGTDFLRNSPAHLN